MIIILKQFLSMKIKGFLADRTRIYGILNLLFKYMLKNIAINIAEPYYGILLRIQLKFKKCPEFYLK